MLSIKQYQRNLKCLGYYEGNIDGRVGIKTKNALKAFQSVYGLAKDGIYGPKTHGMMMKVVCELQEGLNDKTGDNLILDGIIGSKTQKALEAFQRAQNLEDEGQARASTMNALGIGRLISFGESRYFKKSEFECKCRGKYCSGYPAQVSEILLSLLERARENYKDKLIITSGIRCEKQNRRVGGILHSRHLDGKAADCYIPSVTDRSLCEYFKKQPEVRYCYTGFGAVHVDVY